MDDDEKETKDDTLAQDESTSASVVTENQNSRNVKGLNTEPGGVADKMPENSLSKCCCFAWKCSCFAEIKDNEEFASTLSLDEKAYVDGALLVVVRKDEVLKDLVKTVNEPRGERLSW